MDVSVHTINITILKANRTLADQLSGTQTQTVKRWHARSLLVSRWKGCTLVGSLSAQRCETGTWQTNQFLVISSSSSLESVSFLTEDLALSWNVSLPRCSHCQLQCSYFQAREKRGGGKRGRFMLPREALGWHGGDKKIWVAVAVC